jgi:hypothetical protein
LADLLLASRRVERAEVGDEQPGELFRLGPTGIKSAGEILDSPVDRRLDQIQAEDARRDPFGERLELDGADPRLPRPAHAPFGV